MKPVALWTALITALVVNPGADAVDSCANFYRPSQSSSLQYLSINSGYTATLDNCQSQICSSRVNSKSKVASINDSFQNAMIGQLFQIAGGLQQFWIALRQPITGTIIEPNGNWSWTSNNNTFGSGYVNWCNGQPDDLVGSENCGAVYGGPSTAACWFDYNCGAALDCACEINCRFLIQRCYFLDFL
jgi:hypothetical protein